MYYEGINRNECTGSGGGFTGIRTESVSDHKRDQSGGRVEQILDTESSMVFAGTKTGTDGDTILEFRDVALQYQGAGAESVSGISFTLQKGQTLGIIGGTGSGKSSLVSLIPRFYDATEGTVYLKGVPIQDLKEDVLRKTVAIVQQKAQLFAGTIRSNLLWGNANASDEELWQAL